MVCILNLYKSNCGRKINSGHHFNARWTGLKNERAASCPQALVFPPLVGNLRNLSRCDYFLHGRRKRAQFYLSRLLIDFVYPPSRRNHATEPQPWPVWLDKSQKCRGGPGIKIYSVLFHSHGCKLFKAFPRICICTQTVVVSIEADRQMAFLRVVHLLQMKSFILAKPTGRKTNRSNAATSECFQREQAFFFFFFTSIWGRCAELQKNQHLQK